MIECICDYLTISVPRKAWGKVLTYFPIQNRLIDCIPTSLREGASDALWKKTLDFRESGYLLGAGTPDGSDSVENASPFGIVQGHAYSVLDVKEVDGLRFVSVRWVLHAVGTVV